MRSKIVSALLPIVAIGLSGCGSKAQSYVNERAEIRLDFKDDGKATFTKKDGSTMELNYTIVGRNAAGGISDVAIGLGNDMKTFHGDERTGCLRTSRMPGEFCPV